MRLRYLNNEDICLNNVEEVAQHWKIHKRTGYFFGEEKKNQKTKNKAKRLIASYLKRITLDIRPVSSINSYLDLLLI